MSDKTYFELKKLLQTTPPEKMEEALKTFFTCERIAEMEQEERIINANRAHEAAMLRAKEQSYVAKVAP